MKVKIINEATTHRRSHLTTITKLILLEDNSGVQHKFKFSYDAYNAGESFGVELFDGNKFNHICSLTDIGFTRNSSTYIQDESNIKDRAESMIKKGLEFIKQLY